MRNMMLFLAFLTLSTGESLAQQGWMEQIRSHSDVTQQYEHDSLTTIITTRGGEEYTGSVLFAADSILVLWQSSDPYNSSTLQLFGKSVHVSDIDRIAFVNEGHFWTGVWKGFVGGFTVGVIIGVTRAGIVDSTGQHLAQDIGISLKLGAICAIPGTLILGIAGAIQDIDDEYVIDGDIVAYHAILLQLRQRAIFFPHPPPEVHSFMQEKGSR